MPKPATRSESVSDSAEGLGGVTAATDIADMVNDACQKAVDVLRSELLKMFSDIISRVETVERHLESMQQRLVTLEGNGTGTGMDSTQPQLVNELSMELEAVRAETRETLLVSNDNEQYSRRNNVRLCGLKPEASEDCRAAAVRFIKNTLHVPSVSEADIDVAHMTAGSVQSTASQQKRPTMLVRFCRRDARDLVIRSRRILKGTHFAVTEDLTMLNVKTMNRLRNHEQVRSTWSWNGKIFAILSNGKKALVRPFQPTDELLRS